MSARGKHKPIHPGEVLRHEFLEPLGLSMYRLAKETGSTAMTLGRIVNGTRGIGAETALRLARYFGTSPEFWLNLQTRYDVECAIDRVGPQIEKRVKPREVA